MMSAAQQVPAIRHAESLGASFAHLLTLTVDPYTTCSPVLLL